jgi:predicted dehydrogenase
MNRLKLGIIGCGSVVREIYQYVYFKSEYSPLIHVEAVCDTNEAGLHEFADTWDIPKTKRFTESNTMLHNCELDMVAINTPDHLHCEPTLAALKAGVDVILPKPTASTLVDAHRIIEAVNQSGCYLGVDFHKREDPRIKEAQTRFQQGDYGVFQNTTWYMLDKIMVADPNYVPRFFSSKNFAEDNSPVSFLTVHMADAFMTITRLKPLEIRATGYKHKLPSLKPLPVNGYDLVDTEIIFENGGVGHIITGWALPNTAHALTVQSARIIGSEGILDLSIDQPGYHEILPDGIFERNPLFRNFEVDGTVSGYGISSPGRIIQTIHRFRDSAPSTEYLRQWHSPFQLGFYTTAVCEAAHHSLAQGDSIHKGVIRGAAISIPQLIEDQLGNTTRTTYYPET